MNARTDQKGFSLLEVAIGLALMGLGLAATMSFLNASQLNFATNSAVVARDQLVLQIRRNLASSYAMTKTRQNNPGFANCAGGNAANYDCVDEAIMSLNLYDANGVQLSPVNYDLTGKPCNAGSGCIFRVETYYQAYCPTLGMSMQTVPLGASMNGTICQIPAGVPNPADVHGCCPTAEYINVYYRISPNAQDLMAAPAPVVAGQPSSSGFQTITGSIYLSSLDGYR